MTGCLTPLCQRSGGVSETCTDDNLCEWDSTGAVTWAVHGPESTGLAEVEAAIREEFNLRHDEVKVTCHFPESFLIKFKYARHCSVALEKG